MFLRNLRIGSRLTLGFGVVLAILMFVSVGGTWLVQKTRQDSAAVVGGASENQNLALEMKALALEQSSVMRNIGLHSDIKAMQIDEDRARRLGKMYDDARDLMAKHALSPTEREILETLNRADKELDKPFLQA